MVIPLGGRYDQAVYLMEKKDGKLVEKKLRPTLFVPMTGKALKEGAAPKEKPSRDPEKATKP